MSNFFHLLCYLIFFHIANGIRSNYKKSSKFSRLKIFFYKFKLQSKLDLHKPKINFKFVRLLVEIFKGINTDLKDMASWEWTLTEKLTSPGDWYFSSAVSILCNSYKLMSPIFEKIKRWKDHQIWSLISVMSTLFNPL